MKYFYLSIFLFISMLIKAQTSHYFPFADSAVWEVQFIFYPYYSGSCFQYTLTDEDTVINTISYKKVLKSVYPFAAIRQDTSSKKVYGMYFPSYASCVRFESNTDILLYDFSLAVGDTFTARPLLDPDDTINFLSSIDSILIGGSYRARYNFKNFNGADNDSMSIIEGIGSLAGLFECRNDGFESGSKMNSYADNTASCTFAPCTAGVTEMNSNFNVDIYPNPFSFTAELKVEKNLEDASFTIVDICGKQVRQIKNINGKTITLNRDDLANGIYFFQLMQNNKIVERGRFIVTAD